MNTSERTEADMKAMVDRLRSIGVVGRGASGDALAERVAAVLYAEYCGAVGGKAFNGDVLPGWGEFRADEGKAKQVAAWLAVGRRAAEFREPCARAIGYVLRRAQQDGAVERLLGVGTESYALLTAAAAALEGVKVFELREGLFPGSGGIHQEEWS